MGFILVLSPPRCREARGPARLSPGIAPALPAVADAGVPATQRPSLLTVAPVSTALARLRGQAALREWLHQAALVLQEEQGGGGTLGVVPETRQA